MLRLSGSPRLSSAPADLLPSVRQSMLFDVGEVPDALLRLEAYSGKLVLSGSIGRTHLLLDFPSTGVCAPFPRRAPTLRAAGRANLRPEAVWRDALALHRAVSRWPHRSNLWRGKTA